MIIMTGDEWKRMERVIPVSPWTTLDFGGEKKKKNFRNTNKNSVF